jgi:predicted nucleic acid-binding protein
MSIVNPARFFLDTAYMIALLNHRDAHHARAQDLLPQLRIAHEVWVTEAVLTEVANALARSRRSDTVAFIAMLLPTSKLSRSIVSCFVEQWNFIILIKIKTGG